MMLLSLLTQESGGVVTLESPGNTEQRLLVDPFKTITLPKREVGTTRRATSSSLKKTCNVASSAVVRRLFKSSLFRDVRRFTLKAFFCGK